MESIGDTENDLWLFNDRDINDMIRRVFALHSNVLYASLINVSWCRAV
jgi:hypothetical protein